MKPIFFDSAVFSLLGFSPPANAAAPRVMRTQFPTQDLVIAEFNVREAPYNARGDGKTDDTAALQRAIDAARKAGGGVVFLPAGIYRCNR
jgi:polygalacturonase